MQQKEIDIDKIKELPIFFIVGSPRSGTTLFRTFFDAHPNIQIPLEMPFLMYYYDQYKNTTKWDKETIDQFINELFTDIKYNFWSLKIWKINKEELRNVLSEMPLNSKYADITKVIYLCFNSVFPKETIKLIGDKNPLYSHFLKKIHHIFPEVKFIHIIRDYHDHILSMERVSFGSRLTPFTALKWKQCQKKIEKYKEKFSEKFYTIKYEYLVNNPKTELEKICDFLEIDFKEDMLYSNLYIEKLKDTYQKDGLGIYHNSMLQPVNNSKVGTWKEKMPEKEIKIADMVVGKWAEKYGYERKYKGLYPLQYLYIAPIYMHLGIQKFLWLFIRMLPHKTKNKIVYRNSIFEKVYEKIYVKIRRL
jgi:hypothetical protein